MANEGGGKIKMKRQGEQNKPYGRRGSLFGKVTDTVKDMLSPSWLVDLVQSVKKKTPPDSELEHQQQPMRNHYMQNDGSSFIQSEMNRPGMGGVSADIGRFHIGGSGNEMNNAHNNENVNTFTSSQLPLNNFRPSFSGYPHVNGGDDHSEHSDYSASTGGSLAPQLEQRPGQLQPNTHYNRDMNSSHMQQGQGRRMSDNSFLWSKSQPMQVQTNRSHQPSFNISAFGSNPTSPDNSLFGSSYHKSPYYPGKTTFGGAAAHRKSRQHSPSPYQLTPQRKTVTARPVNKSEASSVTSSTAKRILDTLERMSTPLSDAKKIPSYSSDLDSSLTFTPATYRRSSLSRSSSLREQNKNGPPISHRSTPSIASIATNRQPITAKKMETNDLSPKENIEKTNNNDEYFKQAPLGGGGRKMKQERGGKHYSNKPVEEDELVEAPVLPTEFTLPVVAPSFNFGFTPAESFSKAKSVKPEKSPVPIAAKSPAGNTSLSAPFTFASPIAKDGPEQANGLSASSPKTFQFSSPMAVDDSKNSSAAKLMSGPATSGFKFNTAPKPKQFTPNGGALFEPSGEVSGGLKPASQLKSGSVMDFLGKASQSTSNDVIAKPAAEFKSGSVMDILSKKANGSTAGLAPATELKSGSVMDALKGSSSQSSSLSSLFKKPTGSWECDSCMIQNTADVEKCVACTTPKPKAKSTVPTVSAPSSKSSGGDLGSLFKKPTGSWECDTCMIQNKADVEKCVACTTPKPKAKSAAVSMPTTKSSGGDLGALFKKPTGSWECESCMLQNKAEAETCVACTTPKPKSKSGSSAPSSTLPLFKPPVGGWECDTCLIRNKADATKCAACDTPKPGSKPSATSTPAPKVSGHGFNLPKKPSGSWDCDTCFVPNKGESLKCVACQTPKPGAKPTTGFTSTGGFKFGLSTDSGKSTSGDAFKFGSPTTNTTTAPPSGGFKFGAPATTESKTEAPAGAFKFGVQTADKDSSAGAAPATTTGGFKFGASTTPSSEKSTAESSSQPSGGFKFSVASTTTSDSTSTTSKSETSTAPSAGGFKFGVQETGDAEKANSSSNAGGFKFGQKTDSDSTKSSGLGVLKTDSTVPPMSSGFKFGSGSALPTVPEKSMGDKPTTGTGISFTAPTAAKTDAKVEYKPDCAPMRLVKPEAEPISLWIIETSHHVFYDLETSGFGCNAQILQLSAVRGDDVFDSYVEPSSNCTIDPQASEVTQLRIINGRLTYKDVPVKSKPISQVLKEFIFWLQQFNRPVIFGHNIKAFDNRFLCRELERSGFLSEFEHVIGGFVDTYDLWKSAVPNRMGKGAYKQMTLVKDYLNVSYDAHNGLEDVKALQKLTQHMNWHSPVVQQASFDMNYVKKSFEFKSIRDVRRLLFKPLIDAEVLSPYMRDKIIGCGLEWGHLVAAAEADPSGGIRELFTHHDVTAHERIIEQVAQYMTFLVPGEKVSFASTRPSLTMQLSALSSFHF